MSESTAAELEYALKREYRRSARDRKRGTMLKIECTAQSALITAIDHEFEEPVEVRLSIDQIESLVDWFEKWMDDPRYEIAADLRRVKES